MTKKRYHQAVLSAILLAGLLPVGAAQADSGPKEREQKRRVELMVVEKKQSEKPARNNDTRGQRPPDRRR
jgi:hypothetical protein